MYKPKILLYDIETQPILGYTWGLWEQNVIKVVEPWKMLCFAYKFLGEKKIHVVSLRQVKNEKELIEKLWKIFDESDIIIGHNSMAFDDKKSNAKFIEYNFPPPSPYKTIDTLKVARRYFKMDSNKLDSIGEYLGVGRKVKTGGFDLWDGCMKGDEKSFKLMERYNKGDVDLLEKVYLKLRPWMTTHPNLNTFDGKLESCPICQSSHLQKRGFAITTTAKKQRFQCKDCHGWSTSTKSISLNIHIK